MAASTVAAIGNIALAAGLIALAVRLFTLRPADRKHPPGRWFALFAAAITGNAVITVIQFVFVNSVDAGAVAVGAALDRIAPILLVTRALSLLILLYGLRCWLEIARNDVGRTWRSIAAVLFLALAVSPSSAGVLGSIGLAIVLLRFKWPRHVHGWRRMVWLLAVIVLLFATLINLRATVENGAIQTTFNIRGTFPTLDPGDQPVSGATGTMIAIAAAVDRLGGAIVTLFQLFLLAAFAQLIVLPIRLRGLNLKRRFSVSYAMYRVIPAILTIVAVSMGIYFGLGVHRSSVAENYFGEELDRALFAAHFILDKHPRGAPGWDTPAINRGIDEMRPFLRPPGRGDDLVVILRRQIASDDGARDSTLSVWSTPGAPERLVAQGVAAGAASDTVMGFAEADVTLWLGAMTARHVGGRVETAEVYAPVDTVFLQRLAERVQSEITLVVRGDLLIGPSSVTIGDNAGTAWTDTNFTVAVTPDVSEYGDKFFEKRRYLARTFIVADNWLNPLVGQVNGFQLTLHTSLRNIARSTVANPRLIPSSAIALLILLGIFLLFIILETSAVRTGKGIIRGILDDARELADAARRFGQGELSHRINLPGKDELAAVGASFNTMAANIEKHQEVLLEKERLEADLATARDIQQRLLPQSPPIIPGLDMAGISIPSREVGGDLFYFLPVSEGRLGLTIGDVSGKSVPAALLMSNVLAALKTEARLIQGEDQILTHLNALIAEQVEPGRFVTFFYGVIDPEKRALAYANAGHNPPLRMSADGKSTWLSESGVPLGVLPESTYASATLDLDPGDVLVLYSDGVTEAEAPVPESHGEQEPKFFDEHRLEDVVRNSRDATASEILERVVSAVHEFTEGADLSDDVTLVVVKMVSR